MREGGGGGGEEGGRRGHARASPELPDRGYGKPSMPRLWEAGHAAVGGGGGGGVVTGSGVKTLTRPSVGEEAPGREKKVGAGVGEEEE